MANETSGMNISAFFRSMLNLHANLPWKDCERIGDDFDKMVAMMDWISTDNGTTFDRTFVPDKVRAEIA